MKKDGNGMENKIKVFPTNIDIVTGGFPCQDYSVAHTLASSKYLKIRMFALSGMMRRKTGIFR